MSIIGNLLRLTPAQLAWLLDDPGQTHAFVHGIVMAELRAAPVSPERARSLCVEKSWHAISMLLGRVDFPIDFFAPGVGADLGEESDDGTDRRYLSAEQVQLAADWFTLTTFDELVGDLDPADPDTKVYWVHWDEPWQVGMVRDHFDELVRFVTAAAHDGDAILRFFT